MKYYKLHTVEEYYDLFDKYKLYSKSKLVN